MKESAFGSSVCLIEDALVLVKGADSGAWLIYAAGVAPFFGLLLFEITDLVQNPFALEHLGAIAFALAVLYIWLHVCQSVFCGRLLAYATETYVSTGSQFAAAFAVQQVLAPSKLILWPLAMAVLIPHPAVTMFYQHSLVPHRPGAGSASVKSAIAEAKRDAAYRRVQAVWAVVLIFLLRAILWLNLLVLMLVVPSLWKTLTGYEGRLTRAPELLLNPTSIAALCVLAYLGLDPVVKACCVLRRVARQSEASGLDLRLRLSAIERVTVAAMLCLALCIPMRLTAAQQPSKAPAISAQQMHRAIDSVFHDPRNAWDLPVVQSRKQAPNAFVAFMDSLADRLDSIWKAIDSEIDDLLKVLRNVSNGGRQIRDNRQPVSPTAGWIVIGCFSLLLVAALFVAFWNRQKRLHPQNAAAMPLQSKPVDIAREDISALDEPADEWLRLAAQYRANGNLRLSMRALYLATLAALGRSGLISLARGKSNLDYFRELQRRARRLDAEFVPTFRTNVGLFEESWYGAHPVTEETLDLFEHNSSRLRASA